MFTAKMSKGTSGSIMIGFAVNESDITKGLDGITQGLLLNIVVDSSDHLRLVVKKGIGTQDNFDTDTQWVKFNKATGTGNNLDIGYDLLRDDSHTFCIESNHRSLTVIIDGRKFGIFTYPDKTYPLRRYIVETLKDGFYRRKGDRVVHAGFHYMVQTIVPSINSGFVFGMHDLCFYHLQPKSILHPLSRPEENFAHKDDIPDVFTTPDKYDDDDSDYLYMGWKYVKSIGGWLIRRQDRDGIETDATTGAIDYATAWEGRAGLSYI